MKEIPKPVIAPDEPLDSVVARLANYGDALVKQQVRAIDALPDSRKPADGTKRMLKTGHDIALVRQDTIHDVCAKNPALLRQLEEIFGRRS